MNYRFREGRSAPVPAQVIGERLEAIARSNGGVIRPEAVVEDARPEEAAIHPCFTWDDAEAAEKYRRDVEARRIITVVSVVNPEEPRARSVVPAYVSIGQPKVGHSGYVSLTTAMDDEAMEAKVIADALAALRGWRDRYGYLQQFARIAEAIDYIEAEPITAA